MESTPIKDVMTKDLISVRPTSILTKVSRIFDTNNFHHIPVVDNGKLVGIISRTDVDQAKTGNSLFNNPKFEEYNKALFETMMASDIMTTTIVHLNPSDSIKKAYEIFKFNRFHAIPIIDQKEIVGLVTPLDLLDHFFSSKA